MTDSERAASDGSEQVPESESEWRERLDEESFRILRERGTEARFSGEHVDRDEEGLYRCKGCDAVLFDAATKYDSGCGWPSFNAAEKESIETEPDKRHGMSRIEVKCSQCDGHLGHVFDDGPEPTGKRFCINSAALEFDPAE